MFKPEKKFSTTEHFSQMVEEEPGQYIFIFQKLNVFLIRLECQNEENFHNFEQFLYQNEKYLLFSVHASIASDEQINVLIN